VGPSAAMKKYIISAPCTSSKQTKLPWEDQPLVAAGQRDVLPSVTGEVSLWLELLSVNGCLSGFAPGAHPHFFLFGGR
jgi:hypothetical protein